MDPRERQRRRLAVTHRILDAVRTKSFRSETLATRAGDHILVPALHDDTIGSLFDQLRETGGPLHIATLHGDDLAVFAMVPHKPPKHAVPVAESDDDEFPVSRDMCVGIVVDYLILRGKPIIFREASPSVSLELVENPKAYPACKPCPHPA